MSPEARIKQLESQVSELLEWKKKKERQQISFPIDTASKRIISSI